MATAPNKWGNFNFGWFEGRKYKPPEGATSRCVNCEKLMADVDAAQTLICRRCCAWQGRSRYLRIAELSSCGDDFAYSSEEENEEVNKLSKAGYRKVDTRSYRSERSYWREGKRKNMEEKLLELQKLYSIEQLLLAQAEKFEKLEETLDTLREQNKRLAWRLTHLESCCKRL